MIAGPFAGALVVDDGVSRRRQDTIPDDIEVLYTFCFRRWHSKQEVGDRPLFVFSTGLLLLFISASQ